MTDELVTSPFDKRLGSGAKIPEVQATEPTVESTTPACKPIHNPLTIESWNKFLDSLAEDGAN